MLRVGVDLIYLFFQPTLKLFEILKLSWLGDLQCNPANYYLGKALELFQCIVVFSWTEQLYAYTEQSSSPHSV
jgi:hypothetical protein